MMNKIKGILAIAIIISSFCICSYVEHNYTRKNCEVYDTDEKLAFIMDGYGHSWAYEMETEGELKPNDIVNLKMNDNCSANYIEDDVIKKVVKVNK